MEEIKIKRESEKPASGRKRLWVATLADIKAKHEQRKNVEEKFNDIFRHSGLDPESRTG